MKKLTSLTRLTFIAGLFLATASSAFATVTLTGASGGGSISADTAANAVSPAWTTLGTITIAEGANGDFAVGTNITLILKTPAGFEFNTGVTPNIGVTAGTNITGAAVAVTDSSTITITLTVSGTTIKDTLVIGSTTGIQVCPTAGTPLATGNHIYRPTSGGGTATITGITTSADGSSGSNFGNLTEIGGVVTQLAFTTQPAGATAGSTFTTQPVVKSEDQFGNPVTNGLPANSFVAVSLTSGTGPLQGTTSVNLGMSSGKGTATYSGLRIDVAGNNNQLTATSTNGLTSALSSVFTVSPAAASKLVIATQPSSTATAGVAFAQQPVIWIEDTYTNLRTSDTLTVTATRNAGAGSLLGTTNIAAVGGVATYIDLAHTLPTNITIKFTSGSLTAATSSVVTVSAGPLSQLLVLLPGETYAPGAVTGKSGTPTAQTAGTPFTVKVIAVDLGFNTVTTVADTVAITSSDATAVLPANAALINGTNSFSVTLKDASSQTVTATDITTGSQTGTSSSVTVNAGTFTKLQLLMPGETAVPGTTSGKTGTPTAQTAGTAFTVTVNGVDTNWNVVPGASGGSYTIHIASSDANATLPANANLASGTQTFSVTFKTAGSATVTASDVDDSTKTPSTSPSTTVNTGAFAKLQLLMPGETASAGSATGKTGTPTAQNTDNPLTVTVNAVDANWNLINSAGDTVRITSSDTNATLPSNAALSGGTQTFSVNFNTAGSWTVTATDITDGTKTANTGTATTVNVGAFTKLQLLMPGETAAPGTSTGKTGSPSAATAGTALTVTVNAVDNNWNKVTTVTHTVGITSSDTNAALPGTAALSSGTKTFSVTFKTTGSQTVTATDITDGTKTSNTGTATTVNPAAASKLVIATQPSPTATAGIAFAPQPVIWIEDQYNNVRSNDTLTVTATRSTGTGILQGTTNMAAVGGVVTYTNLAHLVATNITIRFTSGALTAATSTTIAVSPAAAALVRVETAANGSGTVVPAQTNSAGTSITAYALARDTYSNFVANIAADAWSLTNKTGGVVDGDLVPASDAKSAVFTGHVVGSANVHVDSGTLSSTDSGKLTVRAGALDHYAVTVSSPNNAGIPFTTTVTAQDSFNNTVTTNTATVTLTATGNVQFDSNGDDVYGDNTKALTSGVLTIATKDNFAETVNITATANSKTGTLTGVVITPAVGAYESVATGNWSDPATWNTYDGSSWVAATVPPASTNAPTITIQSNTTVTVTANVTAGGLIVQSTGQITVGSGQTLTIPNDTGTDLDVAGTVSVLGTLAINSATDVQIETGGSVTVNAGGILQNSGTVTSSASTLTFNSGGTYQHTYTTAAGTIPTATWNTNSTCAIIGYTSDSTAPGGLGQAFANFTWSCTNQQSGNTFDLAGTLTTVNGDFTVTTTGSGELRPGSSESGNLTVGGNFSQTGGTFRLSGDASRTVTVVSNLSLSGGTFDVNAGSLFAFNTVTLNVGGNFSPTAGTFTETASVLFNAANMAFNGTGLQTYTSGATVSGTVNFTVNSGSTLVMGASTLTGSGTFTLSSGAGLQIGSTAGITTSGASGNIQATGTRTFNTGANYTYNGTAAQATGNGLPATVNNLTITNSAGVTLTATVTVNGALTLTNGVLITGANQVNIAATGSIAGGSSSSYVSGTLQKAFNTGTGQSFTYPIGDASNYAPFSLASMSVTVAGSLAAKTTAGEHPSIATSGIDATRSVNRYWTLTVGGSFAATDNATFNYLATDVDGAATASQFVARRFSSGAWQTTTVSGTPTTTATTISGAIASGDIAIGDQAIHHYVVSAATPQTANTPFTTTVTAQDILNQPVTGDSSTVVTMSGSTSTVQFDSNGDGTFGDNAETLSGGGFTISTKDTVGETITITATDGNAKTGTSPSIVVNNANQTISFGPLAGKTYGDAPFAVSATASSGLPVSFSILSGPATVAGSTVTITGAGTVTVRAAQAGNASWNAATNVDQSFGVAQVLLTVAADDQARAYGATNPVFTAGYNGFINGDGSGVLNGALSFSCLDTNGVAVDTNTPVGTYPIVVSGQSAANYNLSYVAGTLTVTQAVLTVSADNQLRAYGVTNPVFTVSYSGFVNGEDTNVLNGSPDVSTAADTNSPVGTYPIVVSQGNLSTNGNYSFNFTNGILTIVPAGTLFFDDFTRGTDPGPLSPWIVQSGLWTVTGGVLNGGPNALQNYEFVYVDTNWTDYSVQGQVQFSTTNAWGGGIGGRLDPTTGAHYAAWIYPEGSSGGSNVLNLVKYDNWTSWTVMQQVSLPGVGTNWHSVELAFQGSQITVYYDTNQVLSVTDDGSFDGQGAYTNGGISVDMWTEYVTYTMSVDNVIVYPIVKTDQTITFDPLANKTYGDVPFTLAASASSGLLVSFSIVSGSATISGNEVTITGAGTVNVQASQMGNDVYNPATDIDQSFNVTPASLTVTADDKSKTQGLANPALTASYDGFVNGENTNALTTQVTLSTAADANSPAGTTYPITASGAAAANYTISYVEGTLTVVAWPDLAGISVNGNQFTLTWPTIAGQNYQVEYKDSLDDPAWTPLGAPVVGTGNPLNVNDNNNNAPQRFYRLMITQP